MKASTAVTEPVKVRPGAAANCAALHAIAGRLTR